MRTMNPYIGPAKIVKYYECSECCWAYPFLGMARPSEDGIPTEKMAQLAFDEHECGEFPRLREWVN